MSNDHRNVERFLQATFCLHEGDLVRYHITHRASVVGVFDTYFELTTRGLSPGIHECVGSFQPKESRPQYDGNGLTLVTTFLCLKGKKTQDLFFAIAQDLEP